MSKVVRRLHTHSIATMIILAFVSFTTLHQGYFIHLFLMGSDVSILMGPDVSKWDTFIHIFPFFPH